MLTRMLLHMVMPAIPINFTRHWFANGEWHFRLNKMICFSTFALDIQNGLLIDPTVIAWLQSKWTYWKWLYDKTQETTCLATAFREQNRIVQNDIESTQTFIFVFGIFSLHLSLFAQNDLWRELTCGKNDRMRVNRRMNASRSMDTIYLFEKTVLLTFENHSAIAWSKVISHQIPVVLRTQNESRCGYVEKQKQWSCAMFSRQNAANGFR